MRKIYFIAAFLFVSISIHAQGTKIKWMSLTEAAKAQEKNPKKIMMDVYTNWCGPCKMMSPILQEVKGIIKDDVKIIKINVDQHQDLASHFMVRGVPTLMLFKSGKMLWRQSGVLSTKDLVAIIQNQLN